MATKDRILCPHHCDHKPFRNESGLAWHLEHKHGAAVAPAESHAKEREPANEESLVIREPTLPEDVAALGEQVTKLAAQVEQARVSQAKADADKDNLSKRLEELERKSEDNLNSLAAVVNIHRDSFNRDLAALESRIDKVQKMIQDLGQGLNEVRTKLTTHGHDGLKSIPELVAKVGNLQQALDTMQSRIEYLARVAKREPTGNMVELALTGCWRSHSLAASNPSSLAVWVA